MCVNIFPLFQSGQQLQIGHERSVQPRHVANLCLRHRGAEEKVHPQACNGRADWMLWSHRAQSRQ